MIPTPTPAPPMPMHAMPAPISFAASASISDLLHELGYFSVTGMQCVVEIDAGENGEDKGLEERHEELERRQADSHAERKDRAEYAGDAERRERHHEAGEDLEDDMPGQHVAEQPQPQA